MKKTLSFLAVALLALFLAGPLAGCAANAPAPQIEYLIGVSMANMREPWRLVLQEELEKEAAQYPNVRLVFTDAGADSKKQAADIARLQDYGIDLLIISPTDVEEMTPIVEQTYQSIPVVVLNRAVEGYGYSLYVGPDNEAIGRMAGEAVAALVQDGEPLEVLELTGSVNSSASMERSTGFGAVVGEYPDIKVLQVAVEEESKDAAFDTVQEVLQALGNASPGEGAVSLEKVDVIFAHNDYMALGAHMAAPDSLIIGIDGFGGENSGLDMVRKGTIYQTITCPTGGREAVQQAMEILNEASGVPKQIILRSHAITQENVDAYEKQLESTPKPLERTIRAGYVQVGTESGWRIANNESIRQAGRDFGIDLTMVDANQSQPAQIEAVRRFVAEGMDVIILSPVVDSGWEEVLREARDAGIPVLLSDRKISVAESDLFRTFIGADFIEEGRRAMRWVAQNVPPKAGGAANPVRILELRGTEGSTPAIERKKGFEMLLEEFPAYTLAGSENGDFTFADGQRVIEEYLAGSAWDIDVIFAHNDDMALGAVKALEENGLNPGTDIKIVSIDGTKDAVQAIIDGKMNCVVECSPLLGPQLMKAVVDLMNGKELPLRIITDEIVFTSENAQQEVKSRKY